MKTHRDTIPQVDFCTDAAVWDAYVRQAPGASNYHQWAWRRVIEETFGHRAYYLAAYSEGEIQGMLPLVEQKSWLFGHFLTSMPFLNYGGVVASTPQAREPLLARAAELAHELGARHVELRHGPPCDLSWQMVSPKTAMVVPLPKSPAEILAKLHSRLRNKIRHAQKHGFEVRWGGLELVDAFYSIFADNMRALGTPVLPRAWFQNVMRLVPDATRILTLWEGKTAVATTLVTSFRDFIELPWIASLTEGRQHYSTVLLYWTALEWAAQNGYAMVDLGRCTPGSGTWQFKRQWNPEEHPLHWYYWLAPGAAVPHLRPDNPKFGLAIKVWQRLPLAVANALGPRIVRHIP